LLLEPGLIFKSCSFFNFCLKNEPGCFYVLGLIKSNGTKMNPRSTAQLVAALALWIGMAVAPASASARTRVLEGVRVEPEEQPVRTRFETDFARRHDRGLLVHADVALVFGSAGGELGLGPGARVGVGWLPWEQVGASLDGWGAICGENKLGFVGPGLRYFFPESAISLGVRAGVGLLDNPAHATQTLLASQLDLAWQPYVSRDWSLGLGLEVGVHGIDVDADAHAPAGWLLGLRLGVTLN
jgi:hypothetical protein